MTIAPELRGEPARRDLLEREAVGVGEDPGEGVGVGHVVGDPHHGAVGRAHAAGLEDVADEQGLAAVEAVDALPRVGVPEEEALGDLLVGVVGVAVELHAVGEQVAEIAEELQVVLDPGVAPDLGGVAHVGVAGGDEGGRVEALHAAIGRVGVAVLHAEVGEPRRAEGQPHVAGEAVRSRRRRRGRCRCSARGCRRPPRPSAGS